MEGGCVPVYKCTGQRTICGAGLSSLLSSHESGMDLSLSIRCLCALNYLHSPFPVSNLIPNEPHPNALTCRELLTAFSGWPQCFLRSPCSSKHRCSQAWQFAETTSAHTTQTGGQKPPVPRPHRKGTRVVEECPFSTSP